MLSSPTVTDFKILKNFANINKNLIFFIWRSACFWDNASHNNKTGMTLKLLLSNLRHTCYTLHMATSKWNHRQQLSLLGMVKHRSAHSVISRSDVIDSAVAYVSEYYINIPQMAESGVVEKDDGDDDGTCVVVLQLKGSHQVTHKSDRQTHMPRNTET